MIKTFINFGLSSLQISDVVILLSSRHIVFIFNMHLQRFHKIDHMLCEKDCVFIILYYSTSCVTFVTIKMLLFTDRQLNLDDWLFLWLKCRGVFNHLAFCSLWFQTYVKLCPKYILQDVSFMAAFKFLSINSKIFKY